MLAINEYTEKSFISDSMKKRIYLIIQLLDEIDVDISLPIKTKLNNLIFRKLSENNTDTNSDILKELTLWETNDLNSILNYLSTFFHLLNQVEQSEIISINKNRDQSKTFDVPRKDSISDSIKYLYDKDLKFEDILELISQIEIHPTFTAHPTEIRRQSIIYKQKKIIQLIDKILNEKINDFDRKIKLNEIKRLLTIYLMTNNVRTIKPTIEDEINNTIKNTFNVLWDIVPQLINKLNSSVELYYNINPNFTNLMKFHNWVGGDRDGNPFVTFKTTQFTLLLKKKILINKYIEALNSVYQDLSIFTTNKTKISDLLISIKNEKNYNHINTIQNKNEPFRIKINCMIQKLKNYLSSLENDSLISDYNSTKFISDLKVIQTALKNLTNKNILTIGPLNNLIIQANVFGFSMMGLDIRQHSDVHEEVINEILYNLKVCYNYSKLNEIEKLLILKNQIRTQKIISNLFIKNLSPKTIELVKTFILINNENKSDSISSYIISMTHAKSDIMEVLLLAKLTGVLKYINNGIVCDLSIVPLYETINDLMNAPILLNELLTDDLYSSHLRNQNNFQEIMLGYSDSNKDGGIAMASYALFNCQRELSKIFLKNKINFRLFHGRGGSISRGGGKSNKAILSLPTNCHTGQIKFTEQGEVITYRYSNKKIAKRHLEQIISAQIIGLANKTNSDKSNNFKLNEKIANISMDYYKKEILSEKCWDFFIKSTPINYISKIPISSRPASRKNINESRMNFSELRAIPWVFSWTQTRYNLTGWFGIGTAIDKLLFSEYKINDFIYLYKYSIFFKQLMDNMSFEMARSRLNISKLYSNNLEFHNLIEEEFNLCLFYYKQITGFNYLLERNPVIYNSINFRNSLTDIMNIIQIIYLKRKSNIKDKDIFLSINAISSAMQNTG